MGYEEERYSDIDIGTQDGRITADPPRQYGNKKPLMPHSFDQRYYNSNQLSIAQQEELDIRLANHQRKGKGTVVPGLQVPRFPISTQVLMQSQSYDITEQRYNTSKFQNKRAAVDSLSNLPTAKVPGYGWDAYLLTDPYDDIRKFLFEDCFRSDPVVRRCLNLEADIVLGTRLISVMDIDEEFTADQIADGQKTQRLKQGLSDQEKSSLQTEFDFINKECQLRIRAKAGMIQGRIGGRSVLEKIIPTGSGGIPTELRVLNWKKLGQIYINPKTWRIIAMEYADRPNDKPLLPREIIHFANDDWNVSPDSQGYGLSAIEPIAATSEINRLLDEVDLKETAKTRWSPTGYAKFPMDTDSALMQAYMDSLTMGTMNGTDLDVTFDQFELSGDIEALINLRKENDQRIARAFGLPNPIIGFENITNRATIDTVLRFYYESEIKDLRTWLQDTLEPQWFDPMLEILAPDLVDPNRIQYNDDGSVKKMPQVNDQGKPMNSLDEQERIRLAAIRDFTQDPEDLEAKQALSRIPRVQQRQKARKERKPRIKVKLEFESISLEPLLEISQALMPMYQAQLITAREFLKRTNMPHLTEEVDIMQEEKKKQEQQQYNDQLQLSKQSVEIGKQRMMQMQQKKSASQNKVASISDQILFNYQYQNKQAEMGLRHNQTKNELEKEYWERKNAFVANLQRKYDEEMAKG